MTNEANVSQNSSNPSKSPDIHEELAEAQKQLDLLRSADPFRVCDMAVELAVEQSRVSLAINARDLVIQRLVEVYALLRQKSEELDKCRHEHSAEPLLQPDDKPFDLRLDDIPGLDDRILPAPPHKQELAVLENEAAALRLEIDSLKGEIDKLKSKKALFEPPPGYDDDIPTLFQNHALTPNLLSDHVRSSSTPIFTFSSPGTGAFSSGPRTSTPADSVRSEVILKFDDREDPLATIEARHAILAELPLPEEAPEDTLKPILLPSTMQFSDFMIAATNSTLRSYLSNYRILPQPTTNWCSEREEHGYFLAPVYKCNTNPRVVTAHRWNHVDVMAKLQAPIECFYNNEGKWYYAGTYRAFRMDDLTTKEWSTLSDESSAAIIKDTLSLRKNISPQNVYETSQLYACGALKVACIALQCVGFNQTLYHGILEQANQLRWKLAVSSPRPPLPPSSATFRPPVAPMNPSPLNSALTGASAWNASLGPGVLPIASVEATGSGLGFMQNVVNATKMRAVLQGVGNLSLAEGAFSGARGRTDENIPLVGGAGAGRRVVSNPNPSPAAGSVSKFGI